MDKYMMNETTLTALQYQQILMHLPAINPGMYPLNRVRVAYFKPQGINSTIYSDYDRIPHELKEVQYLEFELVHNIPLPYWQPIDRVIINPINQDPK